MLAAFVSVMLLLVVACTGMTPRSRSLDRKEMLRVQRLSERLRREAMWPYD